MKAKIQDRNEWAKQRYKLFNEKIDSFKEHKAYSSWLRQYADDAINRYLMRCKEEITQ